LDDIIKYQDKDYFPNQMMFSLDLNLGIAEHPTRCPKSSYDTTSASWIKQMTLKNDCANIV
jgi:hypothetical protein